MDRQDRSKAARLEEIMRRHSGWEVRTLADLRAAGFRFATIDAAYRRLATQRTLRGFSQAQIDIALKALGREAS